MISLPQVEQNKKLTSSEKKAIAKDNERISKQAQQQAYEQQDRDIRGGRKPVVTEVAESLKRRLEEGDFSKK